MFLGLESVRPQICHVKENTRISKQKLDEDFLEKVERERGSGGAGEGE